MQSQPRGRARVAPPPAHSLSRAQGSEASLLPEEESSAQGHGIPSALRATSVTSRQ
jgi:hypothetical protein